MTDTYDHDTLQTKSAEFVYRLRCEKLKINPDKNSLTLAQRKFLGQPAATKILRNQLCTCNHAYLYHKPECTFLNCTCEHFALAQPSETLIEAARFIDDERKKI